MLKFAVFASGSGSNFQSIIDATARKDLEAECALLICDQPEAKVISRAKKHNIPVFLFELKHYPNKVNYEQAILEKLQQFDIQFIALAGYMRLIGSTLLQSYERKIVNIHPSLLPSFPGLNAIEQAIEAGVKVTGVTIHYIDSGMDTGPIVAQQAVKVCDNETEKTLQRKIHAVEHVLYPQTLATLFQTTGEASTST